MLESPLFPSLHHRWESDPEMSGLCKEAGTLIGERNKGLSVCPSSDPLGDLARTLHNFRHLYDTLPLPDSNGPFQFHREYATAICGLQPLVDASKWPRWLLLERAFSSASTAGDLLAAALVLRTQIETLDDLLLLQAYENHLSEFSQLNSPVPATDADCRRIRDHATMLWARFLPMLEMPDRESMTRKLEMPPRIVPRRVDLAEAFGALNDYFHPNYGSHVQAVWPEQASAGMVLLKSFVTIYRTFLSFDWARRPVGVSIPHDHSKPATSWDQVVMFVDETLPRLSKTLLDEHGYPEEWSLDSSFLSVFRERLAHATRKWDKFWTARPDDFGGGILETLGALAMGVGSESASLSPEDVFYLPKREAGLGLPATVDDWFRLSSLRRCAVTLEQTVSVLGGV